MGLRYEQALIEQLFSGVMQMEESVTYQAILRRGLSDGLERGLQQGLQQGLQRGLGEGSLSEARKFLLRLGEQKLGSPSPSVRSRLSGIGDTERLETLGLRLSSVSSWDELLQDA